MGVGASSPHKPVIEIMRPGRYTALGGAVVEFSSEELRASAAAYSTKLIRAVLTIGHPDDNLPDLGTVIALRYVGDKLYAILRDVSDLARRLVREGSYKYISASFHPPRSPANPVPGAYYLRHVGLLGAATPAVKGLAPVTFSQSGSRCVCFSSRVSTALFPDQAATDAFKVPRGFSVAPEALADYQATQELARATGLPFSEAAKHMEDLR